MNTQNGSSKCYFDVSLGPLYINALLLCVLWQNPEVTAQGMIVHDFD